MSYPHSRSGLVLHSKASIQARLAADTPLTFQLPLQEPESVSDQIYVSSLTRIDLARADV
jgi:hypothetical protein